MAYGLGQDAGVFSWPDVPDVGYQDWSEMSGMSPAHPLVGGSSGAPGYGSAATRQVMLTDPGQAAVAQVAAGSPARANWTELGNLKGNPIGWVLIAAIAYLGLMHVHVNAGASAGFSGGKGSR
jgi:hypothetical protein